jgi:hypothetical protein
MQILNYQTVVVNATPTQLYRLGWNAYLNGVAYQLLETDAEKRGYMAANKAEAAAVTGYDQEVWR